MRGSIIALALLSTACLNQQIRDGEIVVLQVDEYEATVSSTCTENFADVDCVDNLEPGNAFGPTIETVAEESGPTFTVLLLDQRGDVPLLVVDNEVIFGEDIDGGFRFNFDGFDNLSRNYTDPSSWSSAYTNDVTDELVVRLLEDGRGAWTWRVTETFSQVESASFTDTIADLKQVQSTLPDPFYWFPPELVYTGKDPFDDGYDPSEDDCQGDNCTFTFENTLEIVATGTARRATGLSFADEVNPLDWGSDGGVDEPFFFLDATTL